MTFFLFTYLDGNMARRIFRDPELLSRTTNVPINVITGIWDLHIALASTLPLCPVKIRAFTKVINYRILTKKPLEQKSVSASERTPKACRIACSLGLTP